MVSRTYTHLPYPTDKLMYVTRALFVSALLIAGADGVALALPDLIWIC